MNKNSIAFKSVLFIAIVSIIMLSFCGCGNTAKVGNPYRSINTAILPSQNLAGNSDFELDWDGDAKAVLLKSLSDESYWSDILYERFLEGKESANGNSPISITVANTKTLKWDTITSYEQLEEDGTVACKKLPNGIRVTYFFEKYKIAVPVEYTLRDNSINVAIDGRTILEDGTDYKLVSVTLTPGFCSVKNDAQNGYLFVPSGCGGLMYTSENANGVREYSGEVYGDDGARQVPTDFSDDESVRLPVFGAAGNGKAMLGIIEEGAGSAVIDAKAGNDRLGYSNVCAKFYVRGYDRFFFTYHGKPQGTTNRINDRISQMRMSVGYYPLTGDNADYSGMANKYREYLSENNMLKSSEVSDSPYSVTFIGGTGITKSILGVPKKEILPLTTFKQASKIVSDLKDDNGEAPAVRLIGYGNKGIRPGSIAGGKGYLSIYGGKSDLADLIKAVPDMFIDYDIVRFAKSGNGFSLSSDVAKTAIKYKAEHFAITPIRKMDENNPYYIISRSELANAADFAMDKAQKYDNKSVSFSTLGTIAFSDYSYDEYINKNKIESDVIRIIKKAKKSVDKVSVSGANSYAAAYADTIFDTVSTAGDYSAIDVEIPFYQMVFHSYKTMYAEPSNICKNAEYSVACALAYGMGTSFMLTSEYVEDSDDLSEYPLYATVFKDNRKFIKESVFASGFAEIYKKTANSRLSKYTMTDDGVSVSTYDNGINVYVNHTGNAVDLPVGSIKPYSFLAVVEG